MSRVELDTTELNAWFDVVAQAPGRVKSGAYGVVSKGALNIKTQARATAPRGPHTPDYANSINYDIETRTGYIEAEIGPEKGRKQWGLGNLLEYGSAHNRPHPHLEPALDTEEPRFVKAAQALVAAPFGGV